MDFTSLFKMHPEFNRGWSFIDNGDTWEFNLGQIEDIPAFRLPYDCKLESDNHTLYTVLVEHPEVGIVFYPNGYATKVRAYMNDSGTLSNRPVVFRAGVILCLLPRYKTKVTVTRIGRGDKLDPYVLFYPKRVTKGAIAPLTEGVNTVAG